LWVSSSIFLFSSFPAAAAQWAKICSSQPTNKIRGCSSQGCGGYNDPRGRGRKHGRVDMLCEDGLVGYAPFTGKINKQARPYGNGNAIDNGVQLSGPGFYFKTFYIKPVKRSSPIKKGEKLSVLLPVRRGCRGITSHGRIRNCDLTGPTPNS
ncbi:LECT2 protein, partial [Steatornis caripensis]|nr:LECT2 protein [Steatornis caripensis]